MRSKTRPACFLIACVCATLILRVDAAAERRRLNVDGLGPRRSADQGNVAGVPPPGTNVYRNEIDPAEWYYAPGAGQMMADDLELAAGACSVVYYNLAVAGDGSSGSPTFDVDLALWDGDPCERGSSVIPGSEASFTEVPNDELPRLVEVTLGAPVAVPGIVWLAATFSTNDAGWVIAEEAQIGYTRDLWSETEFGGCDWFYFLGSDPYAGFWANVNCDLTFDPPGACCDGTTCTEVAEAECTSGAWLGEFTTCDPNPCLPGACCTGEEFATCTDSTEADCTAVSGLFHPETTCDPSPCLPQFAVYRNDHPRVGVFVNDNRTLTADDQVMSAGAPCNLSSLSLEALGFAFTGTYEVRVELWTVDEQNGLPDALITDTATVFGNVRDGAFRLLRAGPFSGITLPERVWMVMSTSTEDSGWVIGGEASVGFTEDSFAIFNYPTYPGVWTGGFDFVDPALWSGFRANVWCYGTAPTGACCNDAAGTCVDGATELQCDGRWVASATCDSEPFGLPCGTSCCATPFGCEDTLPSQCAAMGGQSAPGLLCADIGTECPRPACVGASGDCFADNPTPGCEDPFCCEAVCAFDPYCCTTQWDGQDVCASEARSMCTQPPPPNDHCGDAEAITGEGRFDFDNSAATTDGPPHPTCVNVGGDEQIADDVWYCWTAPCTDTVYVRDCGLTEVDTKIAVYEGCDTCPPMDAALLACNDDFCGYDLEGLQSQVSFSATAGQSYLIRVGTFPGGGDYPRAEGGPGQFDISCGVPDNPACPGSGYCCRETATPGCADETCCEKVCACYPYCCEVKWDADCAAAGPGDSGCGAEVLCPETCICPDGPVIWLNPGDGVVDARQPHPPDDAGQQQGIDTIVARAPAGTDHVECWALCETASRGSPNFVASVVDNGDGTFAIHLNRPITPGAVTTITYEGNGITADFTSHPGNVNRDGFSNAADIISVVDCAAGAAQCDQWQCDADHSGQCAPPDILRIIDLLSGAALFDLWLDTPLPTAEGTCP